jgi:predicted nucleotidyltransferase
MAKERATTGCSLDVRERIEERRRELATLVRGAVPGTTAIYLFGSQAGEGGRPESDVDLAVLADHPIAPGTLFALTGQLERLLGATVDLVDLGTSSTVLRMQVVSTGEVFDDADPAARERFEDLVFSSYARLNEERREILDRVRAEGRIHGR